MPYIGSPGVEVTTQNFEEIVATPVGWVNARMNFKNFSFLNEEDCHVSINNSDPIYLRAFQGWNLEVNNYNNLETVWSFKVAEIGIHYNFAAAY